MRIGITYRKILLLVSMTCSCYLMEAQTFTSSNLPIIIIETNGQIIPDEPGVTVDLGIIDNGVGQINLISDPFNDYSGEVYIEIRGSSSQSFPKKSYSFETRDSLGMNNNVSLLNLPPENDWVLYAPYSDKTLMRNVLTYKLGRELGHYAPRTRYCELVLNGDFIGTYVLMEKIKQDANRVDIAKLLPTDITGDEVTGGYIIKIDKYTAGGSGWVSPFAPPNGSGQTISYQFHDPKDFELVPEQKAYIENYINEFEMVLNGSDYLDPILGYHQYLDINSFLDFLLINEISKNVDGYRLSTFLYKDKDSNDDKIHMGPLWDFNLGFGNANYYNGELVEGFAYNFNYVGSGDNNLIPFWWERFLSDTVFTNALKCRWEELRESAFHTDTIVTYIYNLAITLDDAQERNFVRWPILGTYVWPNYFLGSTYQEELNYLRLWIQSRMNWLDNNLPGTCPEPLFVYVGPEKELFTVFPNPVKEGLHVRSEEPGTLISKVHLYDVTGRIVKSTTSAKSTSELVIQIPDKICVKGVYFIDIETDIPISSTRIKILKH